MIQCLNCRGCSGSEWQTRNDDWGDECDNLVEGVSNGLLIVGEDPYPTRATGIAFCKPTWYELLDDQYSARPLFCGMGINLKLAALNNLLFPTPKEFFHFLLQEKIAFANVNDENGNENIHLNTDAWLKTEHFSAIIACGKSSYESVKRKINGQSIHLIKVVHPSIRNYIYHRAEWNKYWSCHGACLDRIQDSGCYEFVKNIIDEVNKRLYSC